MFKASRYNRSTTKQSKIGFLARPSQKNNNFAVIRPRSCINK